MEVYIMKFISISFFIIVLLTVFSSCYKNKVGKVDSSFIGNWSFVSEDETIYIEINSNSFGSYSTYKEDGSFGDNHLDNPHHWFLKKNTLRFGVIGGEPWRFHVDSYPTISIDSIKLNFDTILPGNIYMVLDGNYFKKL